MPLAVPCGQAWVLHMWSVRANLEAVRHASTKILDGSNSDRYPEVFSLAKLRALKASESKLARPAPFNSSRGLSNKNRVLWHTFV